MKTVFVICLLSFCSVAFGQDLMQEACPTAHGFKDKVACGKAMRQWCKDNGVKNHFADDTCAKTWIPTPSNSHDPSSPKLSVANSSRLKLNCLDARAENMNLRRYCWIGSKESAPVNRSLPERNAA
jgi:hypothetical protein